MLTSNPSAKSESNNMKLLHFPNRDGNFYRPPLQKDADRAAESSAFDALTVQIALKRLDDGTLDPQILVALLAGVGVEQ
jgi:hypothetical protein